MKFGHINLTGIEFEGAWDDLPEKMAPYYHGDGSVTAISTFVGEISSPPMKPSELYDFIMDEEIYPSRINASCGMHVHLSTFDINDFALLAEVDYNELFQKEMVTIGKDLNLPASHSYWKRVSGSNTFCSGEFNPWGQMRQQAPSAIRGAGRYTQLNFQAFSKHGTLENRTFPMFQRRSDAKKAVSRYLEFTEKYLVDNEKKKIVELPIEVDIPEPLTLEMAA